MPNQPNLSITSDMRILAVIVSPANAPAPTLLTNKRPAMTAKAPTRPPSGAHQGIALIPASVGSGRGWQRTRHASKAMMGRKEIRLANHGFVRALRSAPFMGGPQACNAPAARMTGYSHAALRFCISMFLLMIHLNSNAAPMASRAVFLFLDHWPDLLAIHH